MAATIEDILASHHTHRPILMGILNVTPDSFSDGGRFFDPVAAIEQARQLAAEGADILDIGAESTRPGSDRVTAGDQIERLRDVLPAVTELGVPVSIDTTLSGVARYALDCGAAIINDVAAGRDDPAMLPLAAERGCPIVLMHMLGTPHDMQKDPQYHDVVGQVRQFLEERIDAAVQAGVTRARIITDPGIGFGKKLQHNLALLAGVDKLASLGCPVLIGPSRKRFLADLGQSAGVPATTDRLAGTIAACLETYRRGATIFRVHDIAPVRAALAIATAIEGSQAAAGD